MANRWIDRAKAFLGISKRGAGDSVPPSTPPVSASPPTTPPHSTKAHTASGRAISPVDLFRYTPGAPVFSADTATKLNKIRHYRGWVYVAVRVIAEKISQLRPSVGIKRRVVNGKSKHLTKSTRLRLKATSVFTESEDIEPLEDHDLALLLDDPNEPETSADLWYKTVMYWELTGIAYWWLPKTNSGQPAEIWVLPSHWVTPIGGRDEIVEFYRITPYEGSFQVAEIPADDIIVIKHPSPYSFVDGFSPLDGGTTWIDQAESADSSRWYQLANAHNAGMVLELDGELEPSAEDLDAAYAMLDQRMRGPSKNRLPLVLPPGWKSGGRYGMSSEELDYATSVDQIRDMVLALFRVPKGVLGIEPGVANTSAYAPNAYFFDQCINPKLQYLGQILTEKLAKRRYDEKLCIYWHNAAPLNPQEEQIKWDNALKAGACTYNEYRTGYLNTDPYEGFGDEPLVPSGMVPMPTGETGMEPILEVGGTQNTLPEGGNDETQNGYITPVSYLGKSKGEPPITKAVAPVNSIKVKLPDVRQETSYSCGASAFQAVAEMYGVGPQDEGWYRDALGTDPEEGTSPESIRELADQLGLQTIAKQKMAVDELKLWLDRGVPVLILIQAWGNPDGYDGTNDGHYVVAIGYTDDDLIVEDPSLRLTRGFIDWESLDKRWHDAGADGETYDHWGMAIIKHEVVREVKGVKAGVSSNKPGYSLNGNGKHVHKQGQEWW